MDEDRAFDAIESYLCDSSQGVRSRRTVSLVVALRGILQHGPQFEQPSPEARCEALLATAGELTRRGIDTASLVRYGMSREVAGALVGRLLLRLIPEAATLVSDSLLTGHDLAGWCQALSLEEWEIEKPQPSMADVIDFAQRVIVPIIPLIENWILTAPLNDLLLLNPPVDVEELRSFEDPIADELRDQYQWAVDHFTETFYHDWRTSSLHYAYRWLFGRETPPCPPELMCDRQIDPVKLNAEIARRATSGQSEETKSLPPGTLLAPEMVRFARPLLEQGRYREAAAVFEFGARQVPHDGEFENNLGFCLIPDNPEEVLGHLDTASRLNFPRDEVNAYNKMCCYVSMGKVRAALKQADDAWENIKSRAAGAATLWRSNQDGGWELFHSEDPRRNVAEYASAIARTEGWKEESELWRDRLNGLA